MSQLNSDYNVKSQEPGVDTTANEALAGRIMISDMRWYVQRCIPFVSQQKLVLEHFPSRVATVF